MSLFNDIHNYLSLYVSVYIFSHFSARTHNLSSLKMILSTGSPLKPTSYDYVYRDIKQDVLLGSISGKIRYTEHLSILKYCFLFFSPILIKEDLSGVANKFIVSFTVYCYMSKFSLQKKTVCEPDSFKINVFSHLFINRHIRYTFLNDELTLWMASSYCCFFTLSRTWMMHCLILVLWYSPGGTDIIACFMGQNWTVPVYRGEVQSFHLGCDMQSWTEEGENMIVHKLHLSCKTKDLKISIARGNILLSVSSTINCKNCCRWCSTTSKFLWKYRQGIFFWQGSIYF